jgi:diguanylate cyclase (GGDEF)-like protein
LGDLASTKKDARRGGAGHTSMPDETYIELVRLLLSAVFASVIMTLIFACLTAFVWAETRHPLIAALAIAGTIAGAARSGFLALFRRRHPDGARCAAEARRWERAYAALCFAFAVVLGLFCATTMAVGAPVTHLLVTGLLFGYCSGVVARISIRSWIAIPCIILASAPMIVAALLQPEGEYRAFAAFLVLFLAGGIESARYVARASLGQLMMQREFAALARHDDLTGLPNRLALRSHFAEIAQTGRSTRIAIHCLDLDRFKPVNDTYGHPIGDRLLQLVAERLNRLLRPGDLAVRLGGDEFVILQNVEHDDQADMLARRIQRDICVPYAIDGHAIVIGTSVGYALSPDHGRSLERLVAGADAALYRIKRRGGGIAAHGDAPAATAERIAI